MNVVVITIEGVLTTSDDLRNAQPHKWAKLMYDGFRTEFNVILLTQSDRGIADWWLRREGILKWSTLLAWNESSPFTYPRWRSHEVKGIVADGFEVAYFIDTNPDVLHEVEEAGITTLQMSYAGKPLGWRETTTAPRSWSMVVDTVEATQGD